MKEICEKCQGTGRLTLNVEIPNPCKAPHKFSSEHTCGICKGSGYVDMDLDELVAMVSECTEEEKAS